jgi:hypothetical protein
MKKTSLIFAALFAASFAMAQNTATTTQKGNSNEAETTQLGNNTATTMQEGNSNIASQNQSGVNTASITSVGDRNTAVQTQSLGVLGAINEATILQEGGGNTGDKTFDNFASQNQEGLSNVASIRQQEQGNGTAVQIQIGEGNRATINQRNPWGAALPGNQSFQTQEGNNNVAEAAIVNGPGNLSLQNQKGDDNYSRVVQGNGSNTAEHEQIGNFNYSFSTQNGRSDVFISQSGDDNIATTTQTGARNFIDIAQNGFGNNTGVNPYWNAVDRGVIQIGADNIAELSQKGDDNNHLIRQTGDLNEAYATVVGNSNIGLILQTGDTNIATMTQTGNLNFASIVQGIN